MKQTRKLLLQKEIDKLNDIKDESTRLQLEVKHCQDKAISQRNIIALFEFELDSAHVNIIYDNLKCIELTRICYNYLLEYQPSWCLLCGKNYFYNCLCCISFSRYKTRDTIKVKQIKDTFGKDIYYCYIAEDITDVETLAYWARYMKEDKRCTNNFPSSIPSNYFVIEYSYFKDDIPKDTILNLDRQGENRYRCAYEYIINRDLIELVTNYGNGKIIGVNKKIDVIN